MPKILTSDMFHDCSWLWDIICHVEQSPIGQAMKRSVEDSPHHREESVWVHTEMVIDQYVTRFMSQRYEKQNRIALLALLFHDMGKPAAEQEKESPVLGRYHTYVGHEKLSARIWVDFALSHREMLAPLNLSEKDISNVAFLIEHHLPYKLKDEKKRAALKTSLVRRLGSIDVFFDMLRADARGRISDDHEVKLAAVENWVNEFKAVEALKLPQAANGLTAYVLSGAPGAGKTTFIKSLPQRPVTFSLDECRLHLWRRCANPDQINAALDEAEAYRQAFEYCAAHEEKFNQYAQCTWRKKLRELSSSMSGTLVVDNTNLSRKTRARYMHDLLSLRQRPFVIGVSFYAPLFTVLARQTTRGDKVVPPASVRNMFFRQEEFMVGSECDDFMVVLGC